MLGFQERVSVRRGRISRTSRIERQTSATAAISTPYRETGTTGVMIWEDEDLADSMWEAHSAGLRIGTVDLKQKWTDLASPDAARVETLLHQYAGRFSRDFPLITAEAAPTVRRAGTRRCGRWWGAATAARTASRARCRCGSS